MVKGTIGEILKQGVKILKEKNIENPILDSQLILAKILNVDKVYIMTNYNQPISKEVEKQFFEEISKRSKGMPVQYITEIQEFMALKFKVNQSVLIPRPDTEILVEEVIKSINSTKFYNILDIGTGSGCISVSLAKYIKNSFIYSVDISKEALEIAKYNAKLNNVENKIKFFNGDLFSPFKNKKIFFDIIVSNPPYIPSNMIQLLDISVRLFEPKIALDGGDDGLVYYKRIIPESGKYLVDGGLIFLEIGYDQANDVIKLLKINNFDDISIIKDLAGCNRVAKAKLSR